MHTQRRNDRRPRAHDAAVGLGLFSIGLGMAELLLARPMARWMGMKGQEGVIRLYGLREIATGVGILVARDKAPWLWGRVAGDALDAATLAANVEGNRNAGNVAVALGAVAGAAALDVATAQALERERRAAAKPVRDYSGRSGFPQGLEAMRGAALRDFEPPRDMRPPEAMRARDAGPRPNLH